MRPGASGDGGEVGAVSPTGMALLTGVVLLRVLVATVVWLVVFLLVFLGYLTVPALIALAFLVLVGAWSYVRNATRRRRLSRAGAAGASDTLGQDGTT